MYDWFYSFLISECFYKVVLLVSDSVAGLCVALVLLGSCDVYRSFLLGFWFFCVVLLLCCTFVNLCF